MKNSQLEKNAINLFNSGYNCSQSVLSVFSQNVQMPNEKSLHIAAGFGAGMGRLQNTCGAVTGAYMVLGLYNGGKYETNQEVVENSFEMIQAFEKMFTKKHKTTNCKKLINCDLKTDEGQIKFNEEELKEKVCEVCVADAVAIVKELIK